MPPLTFALRSLMSPCIPAARPNLLGCGLLLARAGIPLLMLLLAGPTNAWAQAVTPPGDSARRVMRPLPTVEVVAAAAPARRRHPGAVASVDSARLAALSAVSVKEALRTVPGVHVMDEDAFGLNLNVGLRGLPARRSQRVLLLEDGMPIHLGPYSDPSAHYHPPVDALERIDVVKGAAQIAFGPQTVGGVINFVRRPPPAQPGVHLAVAGGSRDLYAGRVSAGGTWNGRGVLLELGRRSGAGTRRGNTHRVDDLSVRGVVPLGPRQRLALSLGLYSEASQYGEAGLSQEEFDRDPYQNPLPNDVFDLSRRALQMVHEVELSSRLSLRTQIYHQRIERTAWRQAHTSADRLGNAAYELAFRCAPGAVSVDACGNTGRPRRYAFTGAETRLAVTHRFAAVQGAFEAGVRVHDELMRRQERDGATATSRDGPLSRDNEITTRAASVFLLERIAWRGLIVTPGARLERVQSLNRNLMADAEARDGYTELLPGIGVTWTPGDTLRSALTLIAGVHRGFAPPRPADVLNPVVGEGIVQVDAETSVMYEVGGRLRLGNVGLLDVTGFRISFDNQVVRGSLVGSGQRYVNAGRTRHAGLEVGATFAIGRLVGDAWPTSAGALETDVAFTWLPVARFHDARASTVDAAQSVLGRRLPFAPRALLHAGLTWVHSWGARVRVDGEAVSTQYADDANSSAPAAAGRRGLVPAYHVLNASVRLPVRSAPRPLLATIAVKNVLNRAYITDRQEGIMTGAPRSLVVGFELAR
ncbi:MAG: TonB-dependent receptor [Gemmatimonadaceae bacterium]|nr:TonB-dependent receptor [Gemmatimonadaceae bacterium]